MSWDEWIKGGGIMAAGAAITKAMDFVWSNKRKDERSAVKDYQHLLDDCEKRSAAKDHKLEKLEARLDHCEEQHAEVRSMCSRLEERIDWLEKRSDPPSAE